MAAPGESKEGTFCARCFAHVGGGEAYCPECGAPTGEAAPGADSAIHGQLAQANLLRLRGDLDGSEKLLLTLLRRYPNDPLAHEMLGDVCAERGETDRAIEWYELALDLAPSSADVRRKLDAANERQDERTTADVAETLGMPPANPVPAWWPLAASGALLLLAIAVAAWPRSPAPRTLRATVVAPVAALPAVSSPLPATAAPTPSAVPIETPAQVGTEEDRELLATLQKSAGAVRVQSAMLDPRTQTLVATFEVAEGDDPKDVATTVGKAALAAVPAAMSTTLRAVRANRLVFAADLARTALTSGDPLTNVWPATTPPTAGGPSASSTETPATTTPTTGGTPPAPSSTPSGATTSGSTTAGTASNPTGP